MMAVVEHAGLHAVPSFVVRAHRFAADTVPDAGGRHQIPLVRGIDEHLARVGLAALGRDGRDPKAILLDALGPVEPFVANHGELVLADEVLEYALGDVRLEDPHRALRAVNGRRTLALPAILLARLPAPRVGP